MEQNSNPKTGLIVGIVIALLAVACLVVYALQASGQPTDLEQSKADQTTDSSQTSEEAAPNPSERMTITFRDSGFEPRELTVKRGTVITVKNESSTRVQFSSDDHPTHRDNSEMNLDVLSPGEAGSYTASTVGTWGYHDHIDDSKTGEITVTE